MLYLANNNNNYNNLIIFFYLYVWSDTMKIDKRLKIVIAAVILAACAFGGYTYYQSQQTAKQAKAIETADVVRKDLRSTVSATGTISPVDSVEVSPKITARISQVLVKENDRVTAGQTVAILDGKDYEAKRGSQARPGSI